MARKFDDPHWTQLLRSIRSGHCTPFLGAAASHPPLPLAKDLSAEWADAYGYPLADRADLAKVADFIAVKTGSSMFPKDELITSFTRTPYTPAPDDPHAVLASLPIPVYLTTNYDGFMYEALQRADKEPSMELCRWNATLSERDWPSRLDDPDFEPDADHPIVYHLHGILPVRHSLVLTEEDYLEFLVNLSLNKAVVPTRILESLGEGSLLFLGYGLQDFTFRVILRGLMRGIEGSLRDLSVTVQLPYEDAAAMEYLSDYYFQKRRVIVYWGDLRAFVGELRDRWAAAERDV